MGELTVVTYHYVRDLARSRHPALKALDVARFRGQLAWLARHHRPVRVEDVLAAMRAGEPLPPRAALLTFDDGYADGWRYVLPLLDERGLQGCFFPSARTLRERVVLDVNKIHFALASCDGPGPLVEHCRARVAEWRQEYGLAPLAEYERTLARSSRWDDAATLFVKRLLQRGLPEPARRRLTDELFRRFVTADEAAFAEELYLTGDQVRAMRRAGMWFGAHGDGHRWLDGLPAAEQRAELAAGVALLHDLGYGPGEFTVAYPYGGHDATTLAVAADLGFALGFTVDARAAVVGVDHPLRLPRRDTNDLPDRPDGPPPAP